MRKLAEISLVLTSFALVFGLVWGAARADQLLPVTPPGPIAAHPLAGCYGQLGATGHFLAEGERVATAAVGLGCDMIFAKHFMAGAAVRANLGQSDVQGGAMSARFGLLLNDNLAVYIGPEWSVKDWKLSQNGTAYVTVGAETTIIIPGLSAYVEGSYAASKFGREAISRDTVEVSVGARYRLPVVLP